MHTTLVILCLAAVPITVGILLTLGNRYVDRMLTVPAAEDLRGRHTLERRESE
jgi:hypothetical protein